MYALSTTLYCPPPHCGAPLWAGCHAGLFYPETRRTQQQEKAPLLSFPALCSQDPLGGSPVALTREEAPANLERRDTGLCPRLGAGPPHPQGFQRERGGAEQSLRDREWREQSSSSACAGEGQMGALGQLRAAWPPGTPGVGARSSRV